MFDVKKLAAQHQVEIFTRSNHACLIMVELTGIEPVASWLQTRRSPS
jgi:hypothetical protein